MVAPVSGRSAASIGLALAPMPNVVENPVQNVSLNADTDMEALASSLSEGATPLSGDLDITLRSEPAAVFSLPKGAMAQSPRPRARPSTIALASAPAGDAASAPESAEITGDALPSGTRLVQLGAFDGEDVARKEWARLEGKFGRTFYRLRALGFEDEADSRRFCSALVAERAACIPVAVR
jgi:cell division septation protein DedD